MSFCFFLVASTLLAQKDSLRVGDRYWEDQLYLNVSYNVLQNQPDPLAMSSFSYGLSGGYIRDIPLLNNGQLGMGIGAGYAYDSFNHDLMPVQTNSGFVFQKKTDKVTNNKLRLHSIDIPIQLRFRTSEANKYTFWRVYAGLTISYTFGHNFTYDLDGSPVKFNAVPNFNKLRYGLQLSAGYGTFNFYAYYGLTPLFKNTSLTTGEPLETRILKLGLSFYLL